MHILQESCFAVNNRLSCFTQSRFAFNNKKESRQESRFAVNDDDDLYDEEFTEDQDRVLGMVMDILKTEIREKLLSPKIPSVSW